MNQDLVDLLRFESAEINNGFRKASIEGRTTPQEISDRREEVFSAFLRKYFPFPYRIVKGNVIDSEGRRSDSIDCLVLSPSHPYTIDSTNRRASVIFADGVDYAIEIKPDLSSESEIHRALKQIRSIKKLVRKRNGIANANKLSENEKKTVYRIPGIIFSDKTYLDPRKLIEHIVDYYERESVPPIEQFDLIVVNNEMVLLNCRPGAYVSNGENRCLIFKQYGEDTLLAFLLQINRMPRSEMEIGPNVLSFYLENPDNVNFTRYIDLDERMRIMEEQL